MLHTTGKYPEVQTATNDDCVITDLSSPERQLSLLELYQQKLLHRSTTDVHTLYGTGKLTRSDFDEIETGALLSDKHITEAIASYLLRKQFPDMKVYSHHALVRTFPFNLQGCHLYRFYMLKVYIG